MDKFEIRILLLFFVYRAEGIEEMCPSQLFAAHNYLKFISFLGFWSSSEE